VGIIIEVTNLVRLGVWAQARRNVKARVVDMTPPLTECNWNGNYDIFKWCDGRKFTGKVKWEKSTIQWVTGTFTNFTGYLIEKYHFPVINFKVVIYV